MDAGNVFDGPSRFNPGVGDHRRGAAALAIASRSSQGIDTDILDIKVIAPHTQYPVSADINDLEIVRSVDRP